MKGRPSIRREGYRAHCGSLNTPRQDVGPKNRGRVRGRQGRTIVVPDWMPRSLYFPAPRSGIDRQGCLRERRFPSRSNSPRFGRLDPPCASRTEGACRSGSDSCVYYGPRGAENPSSRPSLWGMARHCWRSELMCHPMDDGEKLANRPDLSRLTHRSQETEARRPI